MTADDLTLTNIKRWDDAQLQVDGTAKEVTKVRFWLGTHGPFERTFPRGVTATEIDAFIRQTRMDVQQHYRA